MQGKKNEIKNTIIVIGGSHHNMLGVVRALGMKGIKSSVIITNDRPYSFVAKSKYVKEAVIVKEDKKLVLDALEKATKNIGGKAIIIPTSDFAALLVDENYELLSKKCILPSIKEKQGLIAKYMDKFAQYELAKQYGIKIAESTVVDFSEKDQHIGFGADKYILKPIISANGSKSDICICGRNELKKKLEEMQKKGYERVLVQEFLEFDTECGLIGCIHGDKIVLPGIIKKIRIYPQKRGSNSFARIEKLENNEQIEKIKKILIELNYSGMFDTEIFLKGNQVYLNEINFRNSGNTFAYCYNKVYIVYLWVMMILGLSLAGEKTTIDESFMYIDEKLEMEQLIHGNIKVIEYLEARRKAKARLLHYRKDIKPSVFKYIYALERRILK